MEEGVQRLVWSFLRPKMPNRKYLSPCAADHFDVVANLSKEQLNARYPAACEERWGKRSEGHPWEGDDEEGIPLKVLLRPTCDPCASCGADGEQYFSFCMNRPVNADRVQHCSYCKRCFYYRPGCLMGCAHCGMGSYYGPVDYQEIQEMTGMSVAEIDAAKARSKASGTDMAIKYKPEARGCNVPTFAPYETKMLASEGYWGF
jgi:hypothetical protein